MSLAIDNFNIDFEYISAIQTGTSHRGNHGY